MSGFDLWEYIEARRNPFKLSRRAFLKVGVAATGGLLVGGLVPRIGSGKEDDTQVELNPYVQVDPDGTVHIYVPKSEMGQGVRTSLAMLVAEELDADWAQVRVEQAPLDPKYGSQGTGGSSSVRTRWRELREAGAMARALLVEAAARRWGVDPDRCRTEQGRVLHPNGRDALRYGELAAEAARLEPPASVRLKDPGRFPADRPASERRGHSPISSRDGPPTASTCACRACSWPASSTARTLADGCCATTTRPPVRCRACVPSSRCRRSDRASTGCDRAWR